MNDCFGRQLYSEVGFADNMKVDYLSDDSIELDVWPKSGRETLSKDEVIQAGLSGILLPPKTSRHRLPDHLPPISIPLSRLMFPAMS